MEIEDKQTFGEIKLINWIRSQTAQPVKDLLVPPGDDAAVIKTSASGQITLTTDMLLDGVHFDSQNTTPYQIGWKSLACNLSDVAAMGLIPTFALCSIAFPNGITSQFARDIFTGMKELADNFDVSIIGGDVTSWDNPLAISITLLGKNDGLQPILRSGAKVGDVIVVTGALGGSLLDKHLTFLPRVNEALYLNQNFTINSMIDISDGLSVDLNHIIQESKVGAVLYEESIPVSASAVSLSKTSGKTPLDHALSDGEDYELLFTMSDDEFKNLQKHADMFDLKFTQIGKIVKDGYNMQDKFGFLKPIEPSGYEHLK